MQAIPGLSTSFKNTLKKETASEGKIITPFGFNQHKFTYAAIAACLMVFIGYQQLTKSQLQIQQYQIHLHLIQSYRIVLQPIQIHD